MPSPETLAQRIRRIQQDTGSVDPHELADKVLADLDSEEITAALREALPEFVRVTVREVRNHVTSSAPSTSAKVGAVRAWYERLLAQPIDVSGDGGKWKALRDCTRGELLAVSRHRRQIAAKNLQTADMYERLAKLMHGHMTVGELQPDMVTTAFRRPAE